MGLHGVIVIHVSRSLKIEDCLHRDDHVAQNAICAV